jgi:Mn2+/Fe2+ NRAMP family transporter
MLVSLTRVTTIFAVALLAAALLATVTLTATSSGASPHPTCSPGSHAASPLTRSAQHGAATDHRARACARTEARATS